jgi:hypothetical protein
VNPPHTEDSYKYRKEKYKMNAHKTYTNTLTGRERKTNTHTMEIAKY